MDLQLAEVHRLVRSWGYRDPKAAVWRWRRAGLLPPAALVGGRPRFRYADVVEAELRARNARPGRAARQAARARALATFEALVPSQRHAVPPAQTTTTTGDSHERATI